MNPIHRLAALCLSLAFVACTAETNPQPAAQPGSTPAPAAATPAAQPAAQPAAAQAKEPTLPAELMAKLEKADAKDGAVDHVVHKCAGCSLGMDGKDKFPMQLAGYTMHFCKQACLDRYQKDPTKALLTLKVKD
jgi:YHS domain-containing protein